MLRLVADVPLELSSAADDFLAHCSLRNLSPTTIEWYTYALRPFAEYATERGVRQPGSVTDEMVRDFLSRKLETVSARRVNHYREAIDRFFRWLVVEGLVPGNPASGIAKLREPRRLPPALTEAEVRAILAQPDTRSFIALRDHVLMMLLLDTGLRISEALGLTVDDLDLSAGTLVAMGKGRKQPMVGFSRELAKHLRRYLVRREAVLQRSGYPECPWLFPNQTAGRGVPRWERYRIKGYAEAAGIRGERVSPHVFRHTFAVWFARKGGSSFHLQRILGHTSLTMSPRYCELADVDFIGRQQELSPLVTMGVTEEGRGRLR